jgi:hypothetical protein
MCPTCAGRSEGLKSLWILHLSADCWLRCGTVRPLHHPSHVNYSKEQDLHGNCQTLTSLPSVLRVTKWPALQSVMHVCHRCCTSECILLIVRDVLVTLLA